MKPYIVVNGSSIEESFDGELAAKAAAMVSARKWAMVDPRDPLAEVAVYKLIIVAKCKATRSVNIEDTWEEPT